jgi:hypothetical protein
MGNVTSVIEKSMVTLSNALELITSVVKEISTADVSKSLNGENITTDSIRMIALKRIELNLKKELM